MNQENTNILKKKRIRRLYTGNKNQKRDKYNSSKEKINQVNNNNITNLSSKDLNATEISVLNKGLTFVPHNFRLQYNEINNDIQRFERKLQIAYFFHRKNKKKNPNTHKRYFSKSEPLSSIRSTWWPKKLNAHITDFCSVLKQKIKELHTNRCHMHNMSSREIKALKNLQENKDIIIKKADKNSGIVVMDRNDYHRKVLEMLNDSSVYSKIDDFDISYVKSEADKLAYELYENDHLSLKQYKYIIGYKPAYPIFYGMPKIHKKNCPLRPIVSQISGPTYRINQLIHELLFVAESEIPYLFKDTTAFLNIIQRYKSVSENTLLVTMDVVSLYTNIPHDEAIEYVSTFYEETLPAWQKYNHKITPIPKSNLICLLKFMLEQCTFEFDGLLYKQNYGCPMGAPASVRIANIFMYKLLNNFLRTYTNPVPDFLGRLIDDIFFLCNHGEEELLYFHNSLNNYHKTIKFELNYSKNNVNFLDTTTYIEENTIHTKLFIKPTDKKQYLHFTSCHPNHVKRAIPYSQALRYRRIIDDDNILLKELNTLKNKFTSRGYPIDLVTNNINKVHSIDRLATLQYKNTDTTSNKHSNSTFLPLITTYSFKYTNKNNNLKYTLKELWKDLLRDNSKLKDCFGEDVPCIVYKRGNTIANCLVRARYINNSTSNSIMNNTIQILAELHAENTAVDFSVTPCKNRNCKCCRFIISTDIFQSTITGKIYTIPNKLNCSSSHVIYLITCQKCKKQYVGETNRKLKERLTDHRSAIKTKKLTAIGIHFNDILHNVENLNITPIEEEENTENRKKKELFWIKELQCSYPFGLNFYPIIHIKQNR